MTIEFNEEISEHLKSLVKGVISASCNPRAIVIHGQQLMEWGYPRFNTDDLVSHICRVGHTQELEEYFGLILELGKVKFLTDKITEEDAGEYVIHNGKFYKKVDILKLSVDDILKLFVEELKNEK